MIIFLPLAVGAVRGVRCAGVRAAIRGGSSQGPRFLLPSPRWGEGSKPKSGARVRLVVTVAQAVGGHVGVNLGVAEAAVAEQFLHTADVGPAVEQLRREAVPQAVRAGARVQARLRQVLSQQPA